MYVKNKSLNNSMSKREPVQDDGQRAEQRERGGEQERARDTCMQKTEGSVNKQLRQN